jgi:hypothetical protein
MLLIWAALPAWSQDLLIDGDTVELSGVQAYDTVRIVNGGVLQVEPYDGSAGSGTLELVADLVFVDSTSRIDGRGAGYTGVNNGAGSGPGGGGTNAAAGGGGGHGGTGAVGNDGQCLAVAGNAGAAHGTLDALSEPGSAGGAPGGSSVAGGSGGGSVLIEARIVDIRGRIDVDGLDGPVSAGGEGAGGGAGGGVTVFADALYCEGVISARGGDGGIGTASFGGGGGGGRIEQWSDRAHQPCAAVVNPGRSGCGPLAGAGQDDAVAESDYDADGTSADAGDCDSADPDINPSALEVCDGLDNDCDGTVDDGSVCAGCTLRAPFDRVYQYCSTPVSWTAAAAACDAMGYTLADVEEGIENGNLGANGDSAGVSEFWIGYSDQAVEGTFVWESGADYSYTNWQGGSPSSQDCTIFRNNNRWETVACTTSSPYACESCDNARYYTDADGDGYGDRGGEVWTCHPGADELADGTDCDDDSAAHTPGGTTDPCNGYDDDCDGDIDEGCTCSPRLRDGHDYLLCSSTATFDNARSFCERNGMSLVTIDDATENAWLDGEVDGVSTQTWYTGLVDLDGDYAWLFGGTDYTSYAASEPDGLPAGAACTVLNATGAGAGQWRDDSCDTLRRWVCEEMVGCTPTVWYLDSDGDGYGDLGQARGACSQPAGYVDDSSDCDDDSAAVRPGGTEITADGIDQDCSGGDRCYRDSDGDGYGTTATVDTSTDLDCNDAGESDRTDDCNDAGPAIHPDATETCGDGIDSDCDGEGEPEDDEDNDGLTWNQEGPLGGSDCTNDSDGDGIIDLTEYQVDAADDRDSDGDGIYDLADPDDDDDLIPSLIEGIGHGEVSTECANADDGIPNYLDTDSDGDGILDIDEGYGDLDADGFPDFLDCTDECASDDDGDGLEVCDETALGLDPQSPDSDGDGAPDGFELGSVASPLDTDGDGTIDPIDPDDDDDLVPTLLEDTDGDGDPTLDDTDGDDLPDMRDPDDDGDGVDTLLEDRDGDGDPTNDDTDGDATPDYLDAQDQDGPLGDLDGDTLPNHLEADIGSDPMDFDTDGDGLDDNVEVGDPLSPTDSDGDGIPDLLDPDDDNDTLPTVEEGLVDVDGDGIPNYLDEDSDGDGVLDGIDGLSDSDCDGLKDAWDAHPDDLCDGDKADGRRVYEGQGGCSCDSGSVRLPGALSLALLGLLRRPRLLRRSRA